MSPAEPKPPSSPASKGWYDTLVSGMGTLDALPTGFDLGPVSARRWMGWRLRALVVCVLLVCLAYLGLAKAVASSPWLDARWSLNPQGQLVLDAAADPALQAMRGRVLWGVEAADGRTQAIQEAGLLHRGPRWITDARAHDAVVRTHQALAGQLRPGQSWKLVFADGQRVDGQLTPRGWRGIGWAFWPLAFMGMGLIVIGAMVWLARPDPRNAFYLLLTLCQGVNLLVVGVHSAPGLALPLWSIEHDTALRMTLDLISAAALVHVFSMHPLRLIYGPLLAVTAWLLAGLAALALIMDALPQRWWLAQGTVMLLGAMSLAVLQVSNRLSANPFTAIMQKLGWGAMAALLLLVLALGLTDGRTDLPERIPDVGAAAWSVFFASVLLLVPLLTHSRQVLREFALLAGISTIATSLDLLFVTVFSWGPVTSVAAAVFFSLGVYGLVRDRIVNQLTGSHALTLDRIFEQLYRTGRAIEQEPERRQLLMENFLRELFDPIALAIVPRAMVRSRVAGEGAALLIPAPRDGYTDFDGSSSHQAHAWVLKHAHRGKRLFTAEDARLADRVLQHLRRAILYDRAVERGRTEERRRLAQDLHDDIGARLLTLMYKAQTPELEDYVRHTLQDLKTLTRGLAASEHMLSHAIAEWKADIGQRLAAAQMTLVWSFTMDDDLPLTVTQWSGLTRILRELVSNAIYHAKATRVHIDGNVQGGRLLLWIADDGEGREPAKWSHGLGLGGVRKRVRALGGAVRWRENSPRGIICEVQINHLDQTPSPSPTPGPLPSRFGEPATRW
jgi:signal transduction histidine kinase